MNLTFLWWRTVPPLLHFFSVWYGFYHSLIYAKQNIFPFKPKFCKWEQGMQNIMSSSYPGHFCFFFDFWVEKGDGNGPLLAGKKTWKPLPTARNHDAVSQHISRLGFLLWAGHSAPTGAGLIRKWMVTPFPPSTPPPCAPQQACAAGLGCQRDRQPARAWGWGSPAMLPPAFLFF